MHPAARRALTLIAASAITATGCATANHTSGWPAHDDVVGAPKRGPLIVDVAGVVNAQGTHYPDEALAGEFFALFNPGHSETALEALAATPVAITGLDRDHLIADGWQINVYFASEQTTEGCADLDVAAPCALVGWNTSIGGNAFRQGYATLLGERDHRTFTASSLCDLVTAARGTCTAA